MEYSKKELTLKAQQVYDYLQPECKAIYLGGSVVESYIAEPHDIDIICFAKDEMSRLRMLTKLIRYQHANADLFALAEDWEQTRSIANEEHAYGSYIYHDMELLAGEPVNFKFDILGNDYNNYIDILKTSVKNITNIKRFYQLYRGALIVSKNSYDLTAEEINELNLLHNKSADEALIDKVRDLINRLEYRYVEPEQSEQYIDNIPEQL